MKVLLRERVKDLGGAGDIVEVSEGYARNYLLTQRLAMVPNDTNIRRVQEEGEKREAARKDKLAHLTSLAEKLSNVSITVKSS
ncbi:MAG: 50S ribosomal protein L9, partial [Phycisphaerae bacterium]|nr:50S ribosomal protein L9 [Phycisphaerae bacterium]